MAEVLTCIVTDFSLSPYNKARKEYSQVLPTERFLVNREQVDEMKL